METLDGHRQTQPAVCLHSKTFLEALQLLHATIQTSSFTAAGRDVCGWNKSELPPRAMLVDLHNVHFWKMSSELFYRIYSQQNGDGLASTHRLLQTSLKSELRDGFSLITSFVQSLPSLWPLSVTNTKRGEPKLLLNLLNSRAKAIPTLCCRLLLLVIHMTMTALPPPSHPNNPPKILNQTAYQLTY